MASTQRWGWRNQLSAGRIWFAFLGSVLPIGAIFIAAQEHKFDLAAVVFLTGAAAFILAFFAPDRWVTRGFVIVVVADIIALMLKHAL